MRSLIRYSPADLLDWSGMLDRFFDDAPIRSAACPAVDIRESESDYRMEVEVPGLSAQDVEVEVKDNLLTLSSNFEEKEKQDGRNGYLLRERRGGSFSRTFLLPEDVDRDKIDAEFKNGLLLITLPKVEKAQPKKIAVRAHA